MPGISQKRFHSTIQGPAAEALEVLPGHSQEVLDKWSRAIREVGVTPEDLLPAASKDFKLFADRLRSSSFAKLRREIKEYGEELARRGVAMAAAISVLNRLFEICLPLVAASLPTRATPTLALAQLHALASLLFVATYTGQPTSQKTLVEATLTEAEHRSHGASAYVTKIYERERRRLSHDLHDEVGHDLILIKLYLEMINLSMKNREMPDIRTRLNEAITLVSHAIDSVRRLVLDLGPAVFDELGVL